LLREHQKLLVYDFDVDGSPRSKLLSNVHHQVSSPVRVLNAQQENNYGKWNDFLFPKTFQKGLRKYSKYLNTRKSILLVCCIYMA
jgi:hypothetical protein